MSVYLTLPTMILLVVMLTYVLVQDPRAVPNRLFAWYAAIAVLIDCLAFVRLTTTDLQLASTFFSPLAPLLTLNALFLIWLLLALFIPHRYAQPTVRWLISLPYLLISAFMWIDWAAGWGLVFSGLQLGTNGVFEPRRGPATVAALALYAIGGTIIPVTICLTIAVRKPDARAPALWLAGGQVVSLITASIGTRIGLPVLSYIGLLPLYLAFAWVILRYQIFRPSGVALQAAIERLPDGVLILDRQRLVRYANSAARRMLNSPDDAPASTFQQLLDAAGLACEVADTTTAGRSRARRAGSQPLVLELTEAEVTGDRSAAHALVLRDITRAEQQATELAQSGAALRQRTAELEATLSEIRQRDEVIAGLSLPLIPIAEGTLVLPLIGAFDAARSPLLVDRLLDQIGEQRARTVLLDMTGVTSFDQSLAEALHATIGGARLMGARVALCGVRPDLAESMVHEQIDLRRVQLFATLQAGIGQLLNGHTR